MAGAGAKKFPAFSKLSSADVNDYLADQVIMRFATTTARDAAFGGVGEPTLAEGMTAYIDADNSIYTYDGSNWIRMVSASRVVGLEKIVTGTLSGVTSFVGCFPSEYTSFRIIGDGIDTASAAFFGFRMLVNTTPDASSQYYTALNGLSSSSANLDIGQATTVGVLVRQVSGSNGDCAFSFDVMNPNVSGTRTIFSGTSASHYDGVGSSAFSGGVDIDATTAYDGIQFLTVGGQVVSTGRVTVYGYR